MKPMNGLGLDTNKYYSYITVRYTFLGRENF